MTGKRILSLLLAIVIFVSMVGCSKQDSDPSGTTQSTQGQTENTDPLVPSTPNNDGKVIVGDKAIWEKPFNPIATGTILLDKNWSSYVSIGEIKVLSNRMTDVSLISNYYYDENSSASNLRTLYYLPTLRYALQTDNFITDISTYLFMDLTCTTLKGNGTQHNAIIESVKIIGTPNYYGDGIAVLRENSKNAYDQQIGIGSAYDHVVEQLGEPKATHTESVDNGTCFTTCVYVSESVEMTLSFAHENSQNPNDGVLISIEWTPTTVREELHMQDGIERFENY
jgi:hypothetical protein